MEKIEDLFNSKKDIYRTIEKVITYNTSQKGYNPAQEKRLKSEIFEYVVTESIETQFGKLLSKMQSAMKIAKENEGNNETPNEIGIWVSGFYGSGKSSFTKYFGLAFDEEVKIDGLPFSKHLQNRLTKPQTKALLDTITKQYPAAVVMLDLASEMLTGATMEDVSTVLYYKVLQWAGYSKNLKIAALERKLKKDGRYKEFEQKIKDTIDIEWSEVQNDDLVFDSIVPEIAYEMYPQLFRTPTSFSTETHNIICFENDRVKEMLDIIRETTNKQFIIFVIDEVGQYVGARQNLILNLDGLAKNLKNIGEGKAWIVGTAQQTLTDDDPRSAINSPELYKLKDRFPISVDLPSTDIREICYRRLLEKSSSGETILGKIFDDHGQRLRHNTKLDGAKYYDSDLTKKTFIDLYPFLPSHFDVLLNLLGRLAKSTGGIGLRSAIKVVQDILIEEKEGKSPIAKQPVGWLATTVTIYDSLENDIRRAFPSIRKGIEKAVIRSLEFEDSELIKGIAKTVAILQIIENIPINTQNIASLMHSDITEQSHLDDITNGVKLMCADPNIPFGEQEGNYGFFSQKIHDIEKDRMKIPLRSIEIRRIFNEAIKEALNPLPSTRLHNTLNITSGLKVINGTKTPASIAGEREIIQTLVEFVSPSEYENSKIRLINESLIRNSQYIIYLLIRNVPEIDENLAEIFRCQETCNIYKNDPDSEVIKYCKSQEDRSIILVKDLQHIVLQCITKGSFIFRGQTNAVENFDQNGLEACKKFLSEVAIQVFDRYFEAPIRADTTLAEKFLRLGLAEIDSKVDPLGLVKITSGTPSIRTDYKALVSIRDYIDTNGAVDGRNLGDHFTNAPFGWSKDTLRYLVAALLYAGEITLTISGKDVTVIGQHAIDALKTNNSFNPIGVSLREGRPSNEILDRASKRLTELIGELVVPLENELSKAATKHLPQFQTRFGPLGEKLKTLELAGSTEIESLNIEINEILTTDASDVARRLGGEVSNFYEQLKWANEVHIAFINGLELTIKDLQTHRREIISLPHMGIPGKLRSELEEEINNLEAILSKQDFFRQATDLSTTLTHFQTLTRDASIAMTEAQNEAIQEAKKELLLIPEWIDLMQEEQSTVIGKLEDCLIDSSKDLMGLKKLLNNEFVINSTLIDLKRNIVTMGKERKRQRMKEEQERLKIEGKTKITRTVSLHPSFNSIDEIEGLIRQLLDLKNELAPYGDVEVKINLED